MTTTGPEKKLKTTDEVREEIRELLSHYVDGWDVFKKADDWDVPLVRVDGAENANIPDSWIELADEVIRIVAHGKYGLDTYKNEIEIIEAEHMLDAYASVGMPVSYDHWSFGKERLQSDARYKAGQMGLAYEIVINTDPAIAYCMAQNTKTMQMLVIAHASYGHNSFFKGNHLFQQFTKADEIIPDLIKLKHDITRYEEKYGWKEVEKILDSAHVLQSHGVNRNNKPTPRTAKEEAEARARLEEIRQQNVDVVLDSTAGHSKLAKDFKQVATAPANMEENLLRYIASDAPHLAPWQRDLLIQISDKAQYFYPQRQTQLMNEGWATFWHHTLLNDLHEMGLISDGMATEFLHSHTNVVAQPDFDSKYYSGINPYALGFAMYKDIQRICQNPTDEDREWFPNIAGKDWLPVLKEAMHNYKDESFVLQFLSPKVMRDFHLFHVHDDDENEKILIGAIHDEEGFAAVREKLSSQYNLGDREPRIEVAGYNFQTDRSLVLQHTSYNRKPLDPSSTTEVMKHVHRLWGHNVTLYSVDPEGEVVDYFVCPPKDQPAKVPFIKFDP